MTTRSDVTVDFQVSPRLAVVDTPSTQFIAQDIVDTYRIREEAFTGMSFKKLLDASGKDDLGGGVLVGITVAQQNTQIAFESRTASVEQGTVTTPDAAGQTLTDSAAQFVTNGVERGAYVINFTDQSVGEVRSVDGENQLTLRKRLEDGADNEWGAGDAYKVWNVEQCEVSGGNVVAVDGVGDPISPVFPTFATQIVRTSSSSATLQELQDIQFSSFNGGVSVDVDNITGLAAAGTTFPTGTRRRPCSNFADALAIANANGLFRLNIIGDATFDAPHDFTGFEIVGESQARSSFTLNAGADLLGVEIRDASVTGVLDGETTIADCHVDDLDFFNGFIQRCGFGGTITLGGGAQAEMVDCYDAIAGLGTPTIDLGGSGQTLIMRGWNGGLVISNKTGSDEVSIDCDSGRVTLASSVTAGSVIVRGVGELTDETVGATVTDQMLSGTRQILLEQFQRNRLETDLSTGDYKLYDDDGNLLISGKIWRDVAGTLPATAAAPILRRDRMT